MERITAHTADLGGRWFTPTRTEVYAINERLEPNGSATIIDEKAAGSLVSFGTVLTDTNGDTTAEATYYEISLDGEVRTRYGRSIVSLDGGAFTDVEQLAFNTGDEAFTNDGPDWFRNVSNDEGIDKNPLGQYRSLLYLSPDDDFRLMGFDDSVRIRAVNPDEENGLDAYMAVVLRRQVEQTPSSTKLYPISAASTEFTSVSPGESKTMIDNSNEGFLKAIGCVTVDETEENTAAQNAHIRINYHDSDHSFALGGLEGRGWSPEMIFGARDMNHTTFTGLAEWGDSNQRWLNLDSYLPEGASVEAVNPSDEEPVEFLVSPMWYEVA